jgi:integrase
VDPNYVTKRFIDARLAAGLDHFRLHDLRHFMATQMLDEGVPVPIVAARLAHARASTALNVYAHAVPGGDRRAAEMLWQRVEDAKSDTAGRPPAQAIPHALRVRRAGTGRR